MTKKKEKGAPPGYFDPEGKVAARHMVTVSFTDGTPSQTIPLPVNCGPTLPNTLTVHSIPPREYVRVYGTLYAPKTK